MADISISSPLPSQSPSTIMNGSSVDSDSKLLCFQFITYIIIFQTLIANHILELSEVHIKAFLLSPFITHHLGDVCQFIPIPHLVGQIKVQGYIWWQWWWLWRGDQRWHRETKSRITIGWFLVVSDVNMKTKNMDLSHLDLDVLEQMSVHLHWLERFPS